MSDKQSEADKKRKRSDNTSVSDIDSNKSSPAVQKEKKKHKKAQEEKQQDKQTMSKMEDIKKELKAIKESLSLVMKKDDPNLEKLIKTMLTNIKDDFLKPVLHRIDILESKLFDKEKETDTLKEKIKQLDKKLDEVDMQNRQLKREMEKTESKFQGQLNEYEQYGRRNNIRINGLPEEENESADRTATKAIEAINSHITDMKLKKEDIDIAHRLGKKKDGKRQIIVKFKSRFHAETILRNKKKMKGTDIFVNEDLTKLNQSALMCVKKKLPDEIESAWTIGGQVRYKNKQGNIHTLRFEEYATWFDLPWP